MSNVIGFKAFKNTLKRDSGYAPVSGENGYSVIRCVFPVGGDWDDISAVSAGFFVHPKDIAVVTTDITDGEERFALLTIPGALLKQGERLHFGLFATVGGVTIATNTVALDVERGIVSDDIDYDPEEAAGMFEQFSNALNTALLGKANKAAAGSAGELAALDGNGSPIRSGVSVIQSIGEGSNSRVPTTAAVKTALDGKADKAAAGSAGELAALDGNGALKRSGVTVAQSVGEGSADKVPTTEAVKTALDGKADKLVNGDVAFTDRILIASNNGGIKNSGYTINNARLSGDVNLTVPSSNVVAIALEGKADKAADGTDGELAALDDNGALKRSGVTVAQSVGEGSADKVPTTEAVRNALNDAEDTIAENIDSIFQGNSAFFPQLYFEQYFTANGSNYRLIYDDRDGERHVLFDFAQLPAATGEKGDKGDAGRGVTSFSLNNGILTANFDDMTSQTIGNVKGPQGAPGNDYVLTPQDKADIAGMVDISGKADIADLKAYIGYTDGDILGLHADFENKVFTRLGAAVGLTAGQDFNAFTMYGGRRRCCVSNDGTINAYYGEQDYVEDGSNGQVMVYQPKFYYCMVPLKLEKQASGLGYHIRKANYYVTANPHPGFKLHPLFYDANGNEVDYVLLSAYEGSMYDVSESAYVNDGVDTSVSYGAGDLLCSVAGKKPISGKLGGIGSKAQFETMANNIGSGWHLNTIKAESANQLLMLIELGRFNTQAAIGQGVVSCPNNVSYNCSSYTGSTASLGNATGMATETTYESAGTETVNTTNGKLSVTYRGVENPWGNIWKHINGINLWGDGHMGGGQVFICDDFSFNESKHDGNYQSAGFTISNGNGFVSAFGYGDEEFDWLFMPSETTGNSSLPVGDHYWCQPNLNGYRIALLGSHWYISDYAGGFSWYCSAAPGFKHYDIGGRLLYVPAATVFGPQGPAGSNYALTAADRQAIAQIAMDGLNGNGVAY